MTQNKAKKAVKKVPAPLAKSGKQGTPKRTPPRTRASKEAAVPPIAEVADAPQTPDVAPPEGPTTKAATGAKRSPKRATNAIGSRQGSKTAMVLELLRRKGGVTAKELMKATDWQPHSVRGFLSGTVGKKMGLTVISIKGEDGERTYSVQG